MAVRIGTAPRGLLGALQAKIGGINPPDLGQLVTPTLDLMDMYLADQQRVLSYTVTVTGPATVATAALTVPQGQIWRVHSPGVTMNIDAADIAVPVYVQSSIASATPGNEAFIIAGPALPLGVAGLGSARGVSAGAFVPKFLFPGWRLHTLVRSAAAPTAPIVATVTALAQVIVE